MKTRFITAIALTLGLTAAAQAQDTWTWNKAVGAGKRIEIKGVNGDVVATPATGNEVQVIAHKSGRRSDPDNVKIQVVEHEGGVTICAVYPTPRNSDQENECRAGERGRMNTRNNDTEVDFEVRVPRGVEFAGRTVNGKVSATSMTAFTLGTTVNGSVRISTTGLAEASTVNGGINVRMGQSNWANELEFTTVNGDIVLELPDPLNTEVTASTVNGSMSTDWPLTISGKWGPRRMHGRIGSGGRDLAMTTVNGSIEIRKGN
ncbi:MAG TPA: DUF4097 family beta strand repeat-containing protein [Longimicrobiales bacterium]|nr:DUF4097 family beta strand repeat-containing protein [Longimicrobiales bacterium]